MTDLRVSGCIVLATALLIFSNQSSRFYKPLQVVYLCARNQRKLRAALNLTTLFLNCFNIKLSRYQKGPRLA